MGVIERVEAWVNVDGAADEQMRDLRKLLAVAKAAVVWRERLGDPYVMCESSLEEAVRALEDEERLLSDKP